MLQDLRYGFRMLVRAPAFTAAAVTALALGIGANVAIFSVVHSVLLRPLGFRDPDRLVALWEKNRQGKQDRTFVSPANFLDWRAQTTSFSGMGALMATEIDLSGAGGESEQVRVERATTELFDLLGVRAELGRVFRPGDENDFLVLLSDRLWKRRFGGDPSVVGRGVMISGQNFTVAGVLPPGFQLVNRETDLWTPFSLLPAASYRATGARNLVVVARLKPGVSLEQAQAEMETVAGRLEQAYPRLDANWGVNILPLHEELVGEVRRGLTLMLAAVGFLLLIACVNVANLLLAQAAGRQKEIALRSAVGASPGRIVRQVLCESLMLAAPGGALGIVFAWGGIRLFLALGPHGLPRLDHVGLNPPVLAFSLAASLATALVFGLAPVVALARPNLAECLREGGRGSSATGRQGLLRNALAGLEVALAVLLLVGAGLMTRSFVKLRGVDPGLAPRGLLSLRVLLHRRAASPAERVVFFQQVLDRIRSVPGVRAVGAVNYLPLTGFGAAATFQVEGQPVLPTAEKPTALVRAVDTGYFRAAGIPLLRGRTFTDGDGADGPKIVIVSKALARRFWSSPDHAVGARIAIDFRQSYTAEVVGVVGDVYAEGLYGEPWPTVYCPHPQLPSTWMTLVVRTASEPSRLAPAVIGQIRALRAELPIADVRTMEQVLSQSLATPRFSTVLVGVFACLALLLAAVGVYGVISCNVAARTHEIGIRMALGAQPRDVVRMIVLRALVIALAGVALGLMAAFGLQHLLAGLLYGVASTDAATFVAAPCLLLLVAVVAGYLPALRATRVDPLDALRRE